MSFFKSRKGGAVVLAAAVLFGAFFGSHRSLAAVRNDTWNVCVNGANGDGRSVSNDLFTRFNTASNLCSVAERYPDAPGVREQAERLQTFLMDPIAPEEAERYGTIDTEARALIEKLEAAQLSEQDAKYVSGFRAQLDSLEFTIAHDPYNNLAEEFNTRVLGGFPASLIGPLTGVKELPIYR